MLTSTDEFAHEPTDAENWQENYVWHAWSPESNCGWNLHLGNITTEGLIDVRAHVIINGVVTAGSFQTPGSECFAANGLDVDVKAPFERHRLTFTGKGRRGADDSGWFGREERDTPFDTPFEFDVTISTLHAPFEMGAHRVLDGLGDTPGTGNHYEMGGTWTGTLRSGDHVVEASGMLVRDHSWGGRVWTWDELYWVPMAFADQREFVFNLTTRHGTEWTSFSARMGEHGIIRTADEVWVRLGGSPLPRQFSSAEVLIRDDRFSELATLRGGIHLPIGRTHSRTGLSDMYSTVTCGGNVGFSTIQRFPTEDEVREGFKNALPQYR